MLRTTSSFATAVTTCDTVFTESEYSYEVLDTQLKLGYCGGLCLSEMSACIMRQLPANTDRRGGFKTKQVSLFAGLGKRWEHADPDHSHSTRLQDRYNLDHENTR